jgi:hypothetical protein
MCRRLLQVAIAFLIVSPLLKSRSLVGAEPPPALSQTSNSGGAQQGR